MTATVVYQGRLRTEATHVRSGNTLITDAPVDNHGRGEAFSPTDLVATALATCMVTVMGIHAERRGLALGRVEAHVEKEMASGPRRIARVGVRLSFERAFDEGTRQALEHVARTCPVARSLHPETEQDLHFAWGAPDVSR